ncbi:hypothetical protein KEM55_001853 [Ascosphaera atra]|nr:hypothetical protein KEM55_001853 [Ascosphaera atra]
MAPSVDVVLPGPVPAGLTKKPIETGRDPPKKVAENDNTNSLQYTPGWVQPIDHTNYPYEDFLPSFPDVKWAPLTEVPYEDKGLLGDPNFKNLLSGATDIFDITPRIGTEIHGVNLAKLNDAQKNDLARLLAVRGVVFFRDQADFDVEHQRALGRHYGVLHKYAAYDALSPAMQTYLKSLTALHSAEMQARGSRESGRPVRREPVTTEHPLVRTHPVTGWNALFFNPGFVTKIVGVPKLESERIIDFLTTLVTQTPETQARFKWDAGDVAFWDNRVCVCPILSMHSRGQNTLPIGPQN